MRSIYILSVALSLAFYSFSQTNNPAANPAAVITTGNARFTMLTPELIRMEWCGSQPFEDHASMVFINRFLTVPNFSSKEDDGWLIIKTAKLMLRYKINSGKFNSNNLEITMKLNGRIVVWHYGDKDTLNLLGTTRTLDAWDGDVEYPWIAGKGFTRGKADMKSVKHTLDTGFLSRSGWALIDDSETALFDGNKEWNWVTQRRNTSDQDFYFFGYGYNYSKALQDFTNVAGKIPMPPRYAFGYWWSRYQAYTDLELQDIVTEMQTRHIPLDVVVIDMDWHKSYNNENKTKLKDVMGQSKGWTGYTWNKKYFPEPEKFFSWMEKNKIKNALNLHPQSGILTDEEPYQRMVKALELDTNKNFIYDKNMAKIAGWDTLKLGKNITWDITNKNFAKAYFNEVIRPIEKQGADFWWLDWQSYSQTPIKGLTQTWWINYCFFTDMENHSSNRPLLFHRWGGLGNHRYQIGFSGDTYSTWNSLSFQKYFTATASNVGYGYWSHDIGGHVKTEQSTPELYTRWIQFGVFSPILRTHSSGNLERRIWKYPTENYNAMLEAIKFRYALLPYIYTAAYTTYKTGVSICKPMYYKNPLNEEAYRYKGQYYFGDDMIVSPISDTISKYSKQVSVKVWLPKGKWFDWTNKILVEGDCIYEKEYNLSQIPVFVKAGAIIPMYPTMRNTESIPDTLILAVMPGMNGSMTFYDDNGKDKAYQNEGYAIIRAEHKIQSGLTTIKIEKQEGMYQSPVKWFQIDLYGCIGEVEAFSDGKRLKILSNLKSRITSVFLLRSTPYESQVVEIRKKQ